MHLIIFCYFVAGKCSGDAIRWNFTYDGWKVLAAEINLLLNQISYGAGIVAFMRYIIEL